MHPRLADKPIWRNVYFNIGSSLRARQSIKGAESRVSQTKANFTACDLDEHGVDFCVRKFGATGAYSDVDPRKIRIQAKFDLIWVGSLFTHLNGDRWSSFLNLFSCSAQSLRKTVSCFLARMATSSSGDWKHFQSFMVCLQSKLTW
jgi:hypothetical protein